MKTGTVQTGRAEDKPSFGALQEAAASKGSLPHAVRPVEKVCILSKSNTYRKACAVQENCGEQSHHACTIHHGCEEVLSRIPWSYDQTIETKPSFFSWVWKLIIYVSTSLYVRKNAICYIYGDIRGCLTTRPLIALPAVTSNSNIHGLLYV